MCSIGSIRQHHAASCSIRQHQAEQAVGEALPSLLTRKAEATLSPPLSREEGRGKVLLSSPLRSSPLLLIDFVFVFLFLFLFVFVLLVVF